MEKLRIPVDYQEIVGAVIARERRIRGASQARFGKATGMAQSTIGRIELGKSVCTLEQLWRISKTIGFQPSSILKEAELHAQAAIKAGFEIVWTADESLTPCLPRTIVALNVILGYVQWEVLGTSGWRASGFLSNSNAHEEGSGENIKRQISSRAEVYDGELIKTAQEFFDSQELDKVLIQVSDKRDVIAGGLWGDISLDQFMKLRDAWFDLYSQAPGEPLLSHEMEYLSDVEEECSKFMRIVLPFNKLPHDEMDMLFHLTHL
ncbi:MAG: helix-turn-helix transcriptional regulator [Gammaproteobacteria bacterium]|nr:helix-turn-helix transcriptional regulator [Gammaproteobacteria bacterium]